MKIPEKSVELIHISGGYRSVFSSGLEHEMIALAYQEKETVIEAQDEHDREWGINEWVNQLWEIDDHTICSC